MCKTRTVFGALMLVTAVFGLTLAADIPFLYRLALSLNMVSISLMQTIRLYKSKMAPPTKKLKGGDSDEEIPLEELDS